MGSGLRDLREAKGYSQRGLSQLIGVSERTVREWEAGKFDMRVGKLTPLARALGVSVSEVFESYANDQYLDADEIC